MQGLIKMSQHRCDFSCPHCGMGLKVTSLISFGKLVSECRTNSRWDSFALFMVQCPHCAQEFYAKVQGWDDALFEVGIDKTDLTFDW